VEGEGGGGGGGAQQGQIPVPVDRWQNKSRQSLRAQSGTPTGDQSGYRTPTSQAAQTMADLRGADNSNLVASTSYNNFGRYGHGSTSSVDQSANCIAYQPYSQQQETTAMSATSYPAFEYSQAAGTQSAVSHMSNDTTAQYNAGDLPAGQWPTNSHNRSLGTFGDSGQSTGTQSGHNLAASSQLQRPLSGGSGSNRKRDNYMQYPAQRQARSQHLGQSQNQNPPNLYNNYGHTNNDAFSSGSNWM
jgi:hypothetical protein